MGATTVALFIAGLKPQKPTVSQTRRKTRAMKERAQKRDREIIKALRDARTVKR